ncbi:MAG: acetyl esterase/lipase [Oceanicoccus sp.]|jgi:acetyl esterase/lipase
MNIEQVHPQLRPIIAKIPNLPYHNRWFLFVLNLIIGLTKKIKPIDGVTISQRQLGNTQVRIYTPQQASSGAALIWLHGGGLITGHAGMNADLCADYAKKLNLVVLSVEYRLAPKHPFPAGRDDCLEVWQWLQKNSMDLGIDPKRIVLAGQSAGANLATSLAQLLRDQDGIQPAAQVLFCPMLDDRTATNIELSATKYLIWSYANNAAAWHWYLGQPPGLEHVADYAVPARQTNLSGMPASWITAGELDLFYKEDCQYAADLKSAGVVCELLITPMAPHGFETFTPDAAITQQLHAANHDWLRQQLDL